MDVVFMASKNPWVRFLLPLVFLGVSSEQSLEQSHFFINTRVVQTQRWGSVVIDCKVPSGFSPDTIWWKKNGERVTNNSRIHVLANGSLSISKARWNTKAGRSDEGLYSCYASDQIGSLLVSNTRVVIVSLLRRPFVHTDVRTVPLSSSALLRCLWPAHRPAGDNITWLFNNSVIREHSGRYHFLMPSFLEIVNVTREDQGPYQCKLSNAGGRKISPKKVLKVTDDLLTIPPHIVQGPVDQVVEVGDSITLTCAVQGFPRPTISWYIDGRSLKSPAVEYGQLQINNAQVNDSGIYLCKVEDDRLIEPLEASADVIVAVPPTFSQMPSFKRLVNKQKLVLRCSVAGGHPRPVVTWLKDGQTIPDAEVYEDCLVLPQVFSQNKGYYQCVAKNVAGTNSAYARVQVMSRRMSPNPPRNLRATAVASRTINIEWDKSLPKPGVYVMAYSYHYYPTSGGPLLDDVRKADDPLKGEIVSLKPFTDYTIFAVAYSRYGSSESSVRIVVRTEREGPIVLPEFDAISYGPESIKVLWHPLSPDQIPWDIIVHYVAHYRLHKSDPDTSDFWQEWKMSTTQQECIITGLQPSQAYDVYVMAKTNLGISSSHCDIEGFKIVSTLSRAPPEVPHTPYIQVWSFSSTAVQVNWLQFTSHIQGFNLTLLKDGSVVNRVITLPPLASGHTFSGLDPQSWYQVQVYAFTSRQTGLPAIRLVETQPIGVHYNVNLPPPISVSVTARSNTSVRLVWTMAPSYSSSVDYFTISYRPVSRFQFLVHVDMLSITNIYGQEQKVKGLDSCTLYEFVVRSHGGLTAGAYGEPIQVRTLDDEARPPSLKKAVSQGDSIYLFWNPPDQPCSRIMQYVVSYMNTKKSKPKNWTSLYVNATMHSTAIRKLEKGDYAIRLQSVTMGGVGPPGLITWVAVAVPLTTTTSSAAVTPGTGDRMKSTNFSQMMGAIIGLGIGLGCLVICAFIILCMKRSRCCSSASANHPHCAVKGGSVANEHCTHGDGLSQAGSLELVTKESNGHIANGQANSYSNGHTYLLDQSDDPENEHTELSYLCQMNGHVPYHKFVESAEGTVESSLEDMEDSQKDEDNDQVTCAQDCLLHPSRQSDDLGRGQHRVSATVEISDSTDTAKESQPMFTTFRPCAVTSTTNRPHIAQDQGRV